jgi:hypothetical protein
VCQFVNSYFDLKTSVFDTRMIRDAINF